jgi:signal transduction histidine kinase
MLMWVLQTEMRGLINEADELEQIERRAAEQDTRGVANIRRRIEHALERLEQATGPIAKLEMEELAKGVAQLTDQSADLVRRIEAIIHEADVEREKFVYLAGIGLMTEFIFHELERAVAHTMELLSQGGLRQATLDSLAQQLKTLHKRIAAFDELTGEKRQSKSTFDLADLIDTVLSNHAREFERHGIRLTFKRPDRPFLVKAVRGMIIQILENLIANASYWLKQQKRYEADFRPRLSITFNIANRCLEVEDNGPGVTEDRRERIFQPFVTTKPTGQGRGLGLYISRELAQYHGWKLYMDEVIGRSRKGRINTFVLDMG